MKHSIAIMILFFSVTFILAGTIEKQTDGITAVTLFPTDDKLITGTFHIASEEAFKSIRKDGIFGFIMNQNDNTTFSFGVNHIKIEQKGRRWTLMHIYHQKDLSDESFINKLIVNSEMLDDKYRVYGDLPPLLVPVLNSDCNNHG